MEENLFDARARMPELRFSGHSRDRLRQYDVRPHQVLGALGPVVDRDGALRCPDAAADHLDRLRHEPAAGRPVRIGRCFPDRRHCEWTDTRSVLLTHTTAGRRLHIVVVPKPGATLEIVTLWDPDSSHNSWRWNGHAQLPTVGGDVEGVPTRWCLGQPEMIRRRRFQPQRAA